MTRRDKWFSVTRRLVLSALAGGGIAWGYGQLALLVNGSCSVLCDPAVSFPLGGVTGVFAFWNVGKD